jgi:hypothetical protein
MLGSSWVAAQLAASQEGLSSTSEWVIIRRPFHKTNSKIVLKGGLGASIGEYLPKGSALKATTVLYSNEVCSTFTAMSSRTLLSDHVSLPSLLLWSIFSNCSLLLLPHFLIYPSELRCLQFKLRIYILILIGPLFFFIHVHSVRFSQSCCITPPLLFRFALFSVLFFSQTCLAPISFIPTIRPVSSILARRSHWTLIITAQDYARRH